MTTHKRRSNKVVNANHQPGAAEMEGKFVAYYRVSTKRQGMSGLGLDAQKEAVSKYLNGGNWTLVQEFTEVETGKGADALSRRPVLSDALACCRKNKARLLIAKLDRLARNVHFVTGLMESKVEFVACDLPEANDITIHLMAAFAEFEAKRISQRTKEGLAQAKARGVKLGNPRLTELNVDRSREADAFAEKLGGVLVGFRAQGFTQRRMVEELNRLGLTTRQGKQWSLMQLQRTLARLGV